ncbi:MAG: hypothetical protein ACE5HW_06445, partial [Candidatus Methanofastidiosia archaeon]
ISVQLTKTQKFSLRLFDDRYPVRDVNVELYYRYGNEWIKVRSFRSNSNGTVEMWGAPNKKYAFKIYSDYPSGNKDYMPIFLDNRKRGYELKSLAIKLAKSEKFEVYLQDEEGNPVENARIYLFYIKGEERIETRFYTTTEEGKVEVWGDPNKRFAFLVEKDEMIPTWFDNNSKGYLPENLTLRINTSKKYLIEVRDEQDNPIQNSKISPMYLENQKWYSTMDFYTDRNGVAEVLLDPARMYFFKIEADDPNTEVLDFFPEYLEEEGGISPKNLEAVLKIPLPYLVSVKNSHGEPISGAKVYPKYLVKRKRNEFFRDFGFFLTSDDGIAQVFLDPEKRYAFRIEADDPETEELDYMPLFIDNEGMGFSPGEFHFELSKTKPFKIKISDENGVPIKGAKVIPSYLDLNLWRSTKEFLTSDDGIAQVFLDPERRYAFRIEADDPETEELDYMPLWVDNYGEGFEALNREFVLLKPEKLFLTVMNKDLEIMDAKATLYLFEEEKWSSRLHFNSLNGVIEVWYLPSKIQVLKIEADDPETPQVDFAYRYVNPNDLEESWVILNYNQSFKIRVVDFNGNPIESARILPTLEEDVAETESFLTSKDGTAEIWVDPK